MTSPAHIARLVFPSGPESCTNILGEASKQTSKCLDASLVGSFSTADGSKKNNAAIPHTITVALMVRIVGTANTQRRGRPSSPNARNATRFTRR